MKSLPQSLLFGLVVAAAGAAGGLSAYRSGSPAGYVLPGSVEAAPLADELVATQHRTLLKERLYADLTDGRIRLSDAVPQIIVMNRAWPPIPDHVFAMHPGRSLGERLAHLIVNLIRVMLADNPRQGEVVGRLTAELTEIEETGSLLDPDDHSDLPPLPRRPGGTPLVERPPMVEITATDWECGF
jgi:hypothetical protein